ncbi:hypothetical protein SLA2020_248460 [Shorea laevis]
MAPSVTEQAKDAVRCTECWRTHYLSLSLQAFLILFAQLRKEGIWGKRFIRSLIWLAYLSADWVAAYTMVLIFSSNGSTSTSPGPPTDILQSHNFM